MLDIFLLYEWCKSNIGSIVFMRIGLQKNEFPCRGLNMVLEDFYLSLEGFEGLQRFDSSIEKSLGLIIELMFIRVCSDL